MALSHTLWKHEMIGTVNIDMLKAKRSKPLHILWSNLLPTVAQLVQRILHIPSVPEDNHVDDQPERS